MTIFRADLLLYLVTLSDYTSARRCVDVVHTTIYSIVRFASVALDALARRRTARGAPRGCGDGLQPPPLLSLYVVVVLLDVDEEHQPRRSSLENSLAQS